MCKKTTYSCFCQMIRSDLHVKHILMAHSKVHSQIYDLYHFEMSLAAPLRVL